MDRDNVDKMGYSEDLEKSRIIVVDAIASLFIFIFAYVIIGNLGHFREYQSKMALQVFPFPIAIVLSYIIPLLLFVAIVLLFQRRTRNKGLLFSTLLIFAFTSYTGLILLRVFGMVPCACISIINGVGWEKQFFLNLFLLLVAISGTLLIRKEVRRYKA